MVSPLDKYSREIESETFSPVSKEKISPLDKYSQPPASKDKIYQQYKAQEKTAEETQAMTLDERMQYAQDLKNEKEYLQSAGFTKGAASGLTLGATEHIEGLKPQEHELSSGFGEFVGSAAPLGMLFKAVSLPIKWAMAGIEKAPRTLAAISKLMTAFGAGATHETGKQLVKGEGLDPTKIAIAGAEFAAFDGLLQAGGAGIKFLKGLSPKHRASILEQGIIPKDLPLGQYETAEKILGEIRNSKSGKPLKEYPVGELPQGKEGISPKRITEGKDVGLRPATTAESPTLQNKVGDIFSDKEFYNSTQGGEALKKEIMNVDEDVYRGVNELYKISKELNKGIEETHTQLVHTLEDRINELSKIPHPSDIQKRLIKSSENIVDSLAEFEKIKDEAGNVIGKEISGYKPINNQTMIDQIQSLRQIIDFDFAHGDAKNIFKPLINDIQDSVIRAAEHSGNELAVEAMNDAKAGYRAWAEAFNNDYIRPFRDASNKDYSKLYKGTLDFDESNVVRSILNLSERGRELSSASTRDLVEKNLSKFFQDPSKHTLPEFNKAVRELEAVITPEQAQKVKQEFTQAHHEAKKKLSFKAKQKFASKEEEVIAKYAGKAPEDIQGMMNSRTGIKELRKDLSSSETKKKLFDTYSKQKVRSVLRENNIEKEFTGDELYKVLNKEKNFEILSEILGEEATEAMRQEAKEIGKSQIRKDNAKKLFKKAGALKSVLLITSVL